MLKAAPDISPLEQIENRLRLAERTRQLAGESLSNAITLGERARAAALVKHSDLLAKHALQDLQFYLKLHPEEGDL